MAKKDELLARKKSLTVYTTTPHSPLRHSELLVYSFRADQRRYGSVPTNVRTAKNTGLNEETCSVAASKLVGHGLLDEDHNVVLPCPHEDWFNPIESLKSQNPEGPWHDWLTNWRTLVRAPGANHLTVSGVLVYSLIRHQVIQGWRPPNGWSYEYIARMTGLTGGTVSDQIKLLQEKGFLEVKSGLSFKLFKLNAWQEACFSDRVGWHGTPGDDEFSEEPSPVVSLEVAVSTRNPEPVVQKGGVPAWAYDILNDGVPDIETLRARRS